jgi:hypothetical protein
MRGTLVKRVNQLERVGNFRQGAVSNRDGRGVYTMTILRRARLIVAEESSFSGSMVDAIRRAAAALDLNDEIQFASRVCIHVCGPEVPLRTILKTREKDREYFRRRMLLNFDNAYDVLLQSGRPTARAMLAKRAGAEATNWSGLTKAEKDRNWATTLERAVEDLDRERMIAGSVSLSNKLYPNKNVPIDDPPEGES